MISEKLLRIMRTKSSFSEDQLAKMSESAGWAWLNAHGGDRTRVPVSIGFTGFSADESCALGEIAKKAGLKVFHHPSEDLDLLCVGEDPRAARLQDAARLGIPVLRRGQFEHYLETGEVPPAAPNRGD